MRRNHEAIHAARGAVENLDSQMRQISYETYAIVHVEAVRLRSALERYLQDIAEAMLPDASEEAVGIASMKLGFLGLPSDYGRLKAAIAKWQAIAAATEADPRFAGSETKLEATAGKIREMTSELGKLETELGAINCNPDLGDYLAEQRLPAKSPNWLWALVVKWFLFGWLLGPLAERGLEAKRRGRMERIVRTFGAGPEQVLERREELRGEISKAQADLAAAEQVKSSLCVLVEKHNRALSEKKRLESTILHSLRKRLAKYLNDCETWHEIRGRLDERFRLTVSTVIALREKIRHLDQMAMYLRKHYRDLEDRRASIDKALMKWQCCPNGMLRKDPTKWLGVPVRLEQRTSGVISRVRVMHVALYAYDDYVLFDRMLDTQINCMFWDMMVHNHEGPFVSAAFCGQVLPEVARFHEANPEASGALADDDVPFAEQGSDDAPEEILNGEDVADLDSYDPGADDAPDSTDFGSDGGRFDYDGGGCDFDFDD